MICLVPACGEDEGIDRRPCLARLHPGPNFSDSPTLGVKIWLGHETLSACGQEACAVPPTPVAYTIDPHLAKRVVLPWHIYSTKFCGNYGRLWVRSRIVLDADPGSSSIRAASPTIEARIFESTCAIGLPDIVTTPVTSPDSCGELDPATEWYKPMQLGSDGVLWEHMNWLAYRPCYSCTADRADRKCTYQNNCGDGPYRITIVAQVRLPDGRWGQDAVSFEAVPDGPPPLHLSGIPSPTTP